MAWFIYSTEALPNSKMLGKPGYTPDSSYIKTMGVALPFLPAQTWVELPEGFESNYRPDWKSAKREIEISIKKFKPVVDKDFAQIGVVMLDHKPSDVEKAELEAKSFDLNCQHRKRAIEFYEENVAIARDRQGRYPTSPYVDECYDVLSMRKPYSMEALKAQRDPGASAAKQIADAITGAMAKDREQSAEKLVEVLTRPSVEKPSART